MPGDPLLARPSAESVLPTRGRRSDDSASRCVNAVARMGEVESRRKARPGEGATFPAEPAEPSALRPALTPAPSPVRARAFTHLLAESLPPPPCGEDRLGRRPSEKGAPGMKHLTDEGLKVLQPQGPGLADCLGLPLRLMDGGRASTGNPMPGAPLLARRERGSCPDGENGRRNSREWPAVAYLRSVSRQRMDRSLLVLVGLAAILFALAAWLY